MAYKRKTEDEFVVQGYYSSEYKWEDVTAEEIKVEAVNRLIEYRENEQGTPFRIIRKRIPATQPVRHFYYIYGPMNCPGTASHGKIRKKGGFVDTRPGLTKDSPDLPRTLEPEEYIRHIKTEYYEVKP